MPGISGELKAIAYHEAGHAVVAWRLGLRFRYVTIKPDAGSLGHLMHSRPKWFNPAIEVTDRVHRLAERRIVTSMAGQIAEEMFRGHKPRYGMEGDNVCAVDLAMYLCGSEETTNAFLHYCFCWSKDVVTVNWKNVQAVASALLARESLSFDDVIETIMPGASEWRRSAIAQSSTK